jgi:hypothetical protein
MLLLFPVGVDVGCSARGPSTASLSSGRHSISHHTRDTIVSPIDWKDFARQAESRGVFLERTETVGGRGELAPLIFGLSVNTWRSGT